MRTIKHVTAYTTPSVRLTSAGLLAEAKKVPPTMIMRAWHLYFTDADGEQLEGRAETLQIEGRIGIAWAGRTAWADVVFAGREPDWFLLKTGEGVPIIERFVAAEPGDDA